MEPPSNERREYFRVEDRLFVELRKVDEEESRALEKNLRDSSFLSEPFRGRAAAGPAGPAFEKDDILACLETIDGKLNMILDLLSTKERVYHGSYVDVVLSGSGLKFVSETELDEGAFVEIRLVLPFFPRTRIAALGKVVRSRRHGAGGKDAWETALSFVAISEKDRDILVRYVFSRERESLKKRREPRTDEP